MFNLVINASCAAADGHCPNFALSRRPGFWMKSGQGKRPECNKGQKHNKLGDDKRRL
jgi:hypothetical protein